MSKTKSTSKASKRAEPDLLTKVKDAAITKPAQVVKAKSKELAKQVIGKEEKSKSKKDKKKAKEPTPEPSESEDSDASAASSESEGEEETAKPVVKGKANGVKKSAPKEESSDESDSESSASSESEAEAKAPKVNGGVMKAKATEAKAEAPSDESEESDSDESMTEAKADSSDEESDDDESSEDEKPVKKAAPKAVEAKKPTKAAKADSESESENNGDSDEASDSSDESEDEKETAAKSSKRKADDEAEPTAKKTKTTAVDTSKGSNLFVGNLSWNVDEAWLREIFEEFGELAGVRLMTDRDSGRSKGFGYIEFVNAEDAAKAHAEKAGAEVDGRAMNVDYANARPDNSQKQENRRKSYGDQTSEASDTLFLGNLSFEVGQETVTEAFAPHGTVLGIRLPTDRETGQPKGFGYVTFSSVEEAKAALEAMQGAYIEGRPVRLDYSSPRPQNSDSPARGRGGFGGRGGAGGRGGRGGRGGNFGGRGGRGGRGGGRGGSTNRGGFGDYSGRKVSFD